MNGVARISFTDGALVMPARNRYDREMVFEQAEFYARRHGKAKLELNRHEMLISTVNGSGPTTCTRCGQLDTGLAFRIGKNNLCRRCARKTEL